MAIKAVFNWSGGKDSSLALYHILRDSAFEPRYLFTTLNGANRRVSMHGVQEELLHRQALAIGIPLKTLYLPEQPSMDEYNQHISRAFEEFKRGGIAHSIYGDIFLEDLKEYREKQMAGLGMKAHFPLWQRNTRELMEEFVALGFKAVVVSINAGLLDKSFCGRLLDRQFLQDLPGNVDPCGENGEFHSFVFDGPVFRHPVSFDRGRQVYRTYPAPGDPDGETGFWFCKLHPKN